MYESAIWAGVIIYLLVRLEVNFRRWLKHQEPLNQKQYKDLAKELANQVKVLDDKIQDLQGQINQVAVHKEFD